MQVSPAPNSLIHLDGCDGFSYRSPAMLKNAMIIACLLAGSWSLASEPPPRATYLLLRNGQTIQGSVKVQGDRYLIDLRSGVQMRLQRTTVAFQGESLGEIYAYQRATVNPRDLSAVLRLADWCLRTGLLTEAGVQIERAKQIRAQDPRTLSLQRRLDIQKQPPIEPLVSERTKAHRVVSHDQVQQRIGRLSAETIQQFTAVVQPLVLNRCGTNQCHGPPAGSALTLIRTAAGRPIPQRLTYRNLYNLLEHLGQGDARQSGLLLAPSAPHGQIDGGIFTEQESKHVATLVAWCERASQGTSTLLPEMVERQQPVLAQPAPAIRPIDPSAAGTSESTGQQAQASQLPSFSKTDPFDPAPFNERYHQRRLPAVLPSLHR